MPRLLPLTVLILLVGCDPGSGLVPADPSYSTEVQAIFDASCVGCHTATGPSGDYSLTTRTGALGAGSDSVPNVLAGDADSSKLYRRITSETPLMPQGSPALDTVKTGTVRNWIDQGAKDN